MDAMLKRRMWKVAIAHFLFSVLVVGGVLFALPLRGAADLVGALINFCGQASILLQPISCLVDFNGHELLGLILMPLWSLCFGWIFVRLDNWLNLFPILGKRVF